MPQRHSKKHCMYMLHVTDDMRGHLAYVLMECSHTMAMCNVKRHKSVWTSVNHSSIGTVLSHPWMKSSFYPTTLKGYGVLSTPKWVVGQLGGHQGRKKTFKTFASTIFHVLFSNIAKQFIVIISRQAWLRKLCLIKYVHNGPFNEHLILAFPSSFLKSKLWHLLQM